MTSIASIIVLLQMAISLLTTPNLPPAVQQQAQTIANQAVALATQALQQAPTTPLGMVATSSPVYTQNTASGVNVVVNPPVATGAPAPDSVTVVPSCTLTGMVTPDKNNLTFDWTSTDPSGGTLYFADGHNGSDVDWKSEGPLSKSRKYVFLFGRKVYKAEIGNAKCYAFFNFDRSDVSTSTPFASFPGL